MTTLQDIYARHDSLFSLITEFNSSPATYAHPDYFSSLEPTWLERIRNLPRALAKLNHMLLQQFELHQHFITDFSDPRKRLALVDTRSLQTLLVYAGIVYYSANITQIVQKPLILALKEAIGEDAYTFALKKAPFFTSVKPHITSLSPNPANLQISIYTAGQRLFEHSFAGESPSLTRRLQLKFPSAYTWNFQRSVTPESRNESYAFLHRLLTKEINPEWQLCFT